MPQIACAWPARPFCLWTRTPPSDHDEQRGLVRKSKVVSVASKADQVRVMIKAVDVVAEDVTERNDASCADDLADLARLRASLALELDPDG